MPPLSGSILQKRGGPYLPTVQTLGYTPDSAADINLSIVLLFLYLTAGLLHFAILQYNKRHGHKFIINGLVFGFAKIRIIAYALRDAWASYPNNASLAVASTFFMTAGAFLLLVANLVFAQRIVRAQHPRFGWSKPASMALPVIVGFTILAIMTLIIATFQQAFSADDYIHYISHILVLYGLTFLTVVSIMPAVVVLVSSLVGRLPKVQIRRTLRPVDKFGKGRMTHNVMVVISGAVILSIGSLFKTVVAYLPEIPVTVPGSNPSTLSPVPWYVSKAAFYAFSPVPELLVMFMWLFVRIDRRFHVPNKARGSYCAPQVQDKPNTSEKEQDKRKDLEKATSSRSSARFSATTRVLEDSDSIVVLDAFFGGQGGSPETIRGDEKVAGQAAYNIQDVISSVMKAWEMRREIQEYETVADEGVLAATALDDRAGTDAVLSLGEAAEAPDVPMSQVSPLLSEDSDSLKVARSRLEEIERRESQRVTGGSVRAPSLTSSYRSSKQPSRSSSKTAPV